VPNLSLLQLAGQRVIYSYRGLNPPAGLFWLIRHGEAAGVIFFTGNIGSTPPTSAQLAHFKSVVASLRAAATSRTNPVHQPLLLMTDQEGGVVRRLPGPPLLSAKQVGLAANPAAAAANAGAGARDNLHGFGLNVNLAPVLDVYRQPGNFIDQFGRSFSNNPQTVAKLGTLYAKAEQQGHLVAATVKHFPGLGAATRSQNTDARPVTLTVPLRRLRAVDELPYRSAIAGGVKLVMVSWAIYPALDPAKPAGLSSTIVRGELRRRLGFAGVTITDAISAGALKPFGTTARRVTLAGGAGMDLLLCASQNYGEGDTALHALASYYSAGSATTKAAFKAAAERVMALRATLPR
jgi:beta-N-acetylhexosaminidase